jgi:hypothetical protein
MVIASQIHRVRFAVVVEESRFEVVRHQQCDDLLGFGRLRRNSIPTWRKYQVGAFFDVA